ncbi:MAG: aldo/keto reductase [Micromonosporaceae bacterium]|nr:aldo/keto reductase [Micromonosporaceae bacterium]
MRRRSLPRGGLSLTELGLGTSQMGNLYRETTDEQASAALETAWRGGVRYFDTAPHYGLGLSERRLGALLRRYPRAEYVVSTKVGRLLEPAGGAGMDGEGFAVPATHRRVWDFSADGVRRSIVDSLDRLGLDRIDIVYLHDPDDHWEQAAHEGVPALVQLRGEGVVRAVGVGINQAAMAARFVAETDIDLVMIAGRYTLLEQGAGRALLQQAERRGVGVVVAGVYNSGLLARDRPVPGARYDYAPAPAELVERANRIADVCQRYGVRLPEAAIGFVLRHPAVVGVVVGARDGGQVDETLSRYRSRPPEPLWADLAAEGLLDDR